MTAFGEGVHQFDRLTGSFKTYKKVLLNDEISNTNFCYGVFEASDNNFYVITFDEGLLKLDRETGKFTTIHSTPFHNLSNCIAEDHSKRLWIGTNNGLKCYNLETTLFSG